MKIDNPNSQSGFTLIMSMIFLLVLTVLGLSATQSTRMEVAMAGNMRDSDISFQAAEAGLSSAEEFIESTVSKTDFNDTNGLYAAETVDPDYFDNTSWANVREASGTSLALSSATPKFIIKYLGDRSQNEVAAVNIGGYGTAQPGFTVSNFRVTARGFGQTDRANRMIQSYYGKEF
jgi:type IV pilus assembly protein PilX